MSNQFLFNRIALTHHIRSTSPPLADFLPVSLPYLLQNYQIYLITVEKTQGGDYYDPGVIDRMSQGGVTSFPTLSRAVNSRLEYPGVIFINPSTERIDYFLSGFLLWLRENANLL
jgi:hypothetical protein